MSRFKTVLFFLFVCGGLLPAGSALAQSGEAIDRFEVTLNLQPDSSVSVEERILYDFGGTPERHGIYRDIPLLYSSEDGSDYRADIQVDSVTDEKGEPYTYEETRGSMLRLKIGDADVIVSGQKWYVIRYRFAQVMNGFEGHDELYWNVTGNGWPVPVRAAQASVTLDGFSGKPLQTACYTGPEGSTAADCDTKVTAGGMEVKTQNALGAYEGLTLVIGFPKGHVTLPAIVSASAAPEGSDLSLDDAYQGTMPLTLRVAPGEHRFLADKIGYGAEEKTLTLVSGQKSSLSFELKESLLGRFFRTFFPFLLFVGLSGEAFRRWRKHGREPRGRGTIIPEYEPPKGLTVAEAATVVDQRFDQTEITATILELAMKGFLDIHRDESPGLLWGKNFEYRFTLSSGKPRDGLAEHEKMLLDALFGAATEVKLSELKYELSSKLTPIKNTVYKRLVDKQYFTQNPEKARGNTLGCGIAIIFLGLFFGFFMAGLFETPLYILCVVPAGIVFIVFSFFMGRWSEKGRRTAEDMEGLKLFMTVTIKDRVKAMQGPENFEKLFESLLPFAVALGVEAAWAGAFAGLLQNPPSWYHGHGPFIPSAFASDLHSIAEGTANAFSSKPSSGGSGFSGGGSGGGFGGGGGGSW